MEPVGRFEAEVLRIEKFVAKNGYSMEYDNSGQLIIYTGLFAQEDGSIDDKEDLENSNEPS